MEFKILFPASPFDQEDNNNKYFNACKKIADIECDKISENGSCLFHFESNYEDTEHKVKLISWTGGYDVPVRLESVINKRLSLIDQSNEDRHSTPESINILYNLIKDIKQTDEIRKWIKLNTENLTQASLNMPPDIQFIVRNPTDPNNLLFLLMAVTNRQVRLEEAQGVLNLLESEPMS